MDSYIEGAEPIIQGTFRNVDGTLITPSAYHIDVLDPSGTVTTYTTPDVTNPSVGILELLVAANLVGVWRYVWTATVAGQDVTVAGGFCVLDDGMGS